MTAHLDLLKDIGPGGILSLRAKRHAETCSECRKRANTLLGLAKAFRRTQTSANELLAATRWRDCIPTEEMLRLASPSAPAIPAKLAAHLKACPDCAAEFEEAKLALAEPGIVPALRARLKSLPDRLLGKIRDLVPGTALPVAAIPKNITRPSKSRKTGTVRRSRKKKRSD